jgi:hypothetical protein
MVVQHSCSSTLQNFVPLSRFHNDEVQSIISDIELESLSELPRSSPYIPNERIQSAIKRAELYREIIRIPAAEMSNELFDFLWSPENPYPFVVTGIHERLQYLWNPGFFRKILGDESCKIENCRTGDVQTIKARDFFRNFGLDLDGGEVFRLKVCISAFLSVFILHSGLGLATRFKFQNH